MNRKTFVLRLTGSIMVALAMAPWLSASPASAGNNSSGSPGDHKVTICHRTHSDSNAYVVITVDTDAAGGGKDAGAGDHAAEHQGPLWSSTLKADHIEWGDIIPPYLDDQGVSFPGYNWSPEGQAIYANDCQAVTPATTSPPVTTSTSAPAKTTTSAPATTTTSAAATTTTSAAATTATTSAAAVTTGAVSVLPTKVAASTTPPEEAGATSSAAVLGEQAGALPKMGAGLPVAMTVGLSLALLLAGAALILLPGRLAAERNRRH